MEYYVADAAKSRLIIFILYNEILFLILQAEAEAKNLRHEIEARHGGPHIYSIKNVSELDSLTSLELKQIHKQLKVDICRLEKVGVLKIIIFSREDVIFFNILLLHFALHVVDIKKVSDQARILMRSTF